MNRLTSLSSQVFDVIIIGGGIIGAGIARDAALRGLKVALFEKEDFGRGTTSGSTRLVHGGLRYLEMLDFKLVRLDLRERETLLRIAPHLVKPLEFLIPFYRRGALYRSKLRLGMMLYDLLSYDKSLPRHRALNADEIKKLEPSLAAHDLQGALAYYDAQVASPERLCLENVIDAREHGAQVFNYAEVVGVLREGQTICGVQVRDAINGDAENVHIKGRLVVNASGPWFNQVANKLSANSAAQIRTTKGIHLTGPLVNRHALVLFSPLDKRLFFVIPWLGYSWIGTTDTDYKDDPGEARAESSDLAYLRESVKPYLPELAEAPVFFGNAGVRALVMQEGSESSVSRMHRISDDSQYGAPGLISVLGGKITGYRAIAEEAVDLVCAKLKLKRPCRTADTPLPGAEKTKGETDDKSGLSQNIIAHLKNLYGSRANGVLRLIAENNELAEQLSPDYPEVAAQVIYAIRHEQCLRLNDFILRRTILGFSRDQGLSALGKTVSLMAHELGWSSSRQNDEIRAYHHYIEKTQAFQTGVK